MKADALKGHLEGMLLAVLEPGELHGYAVIEALRERSGGQISLPSGTVYPALHRLEAAGLVRGAWSQRDGRRRRSYTLTTSGLEALAERRTSWREMAVVVTTVMGGPWPSPT